NRLTMTADRIRQLLAQVQTGGINAEEAARRLKTLPYENLGFAAVDHHRVFRQGMAEAIFCEGKTAAQAVAIARRLLRNRHPVLATRVEPALARALLRLDRRARYEPLGRTVVLARPSVVGGMFGQPVIAVPTSRGYGASFGGLSALLAMLNSCAAGVAVVNIDNGYGAACLAHRINSLSVS